jgi:hypothetical protein
MIGRAIDKITAMAAMAYQILRFPMKLNERSPE